MVAAQESGGVRRAQESGDERRSPTQEGRTRRNTLSSAGGGLAPGTDEEVLISLTSEKTSQRQTSSNTRSLQNQIYTNVSNGHNIILIKEKDQIIIKPDHQTALQTDLSMNSPRIKSPLPTNKHTEINPQSREVFLFVCGESVGRAGTIIVPPQ